MNEIQIHFLKQEPAPAMKDLIPGERVFCLVMMEEAVVVGPSDLPGRVEIQCKTRGAYHAAPRNLRLLLEV